MRGGSLSDTCTPDFFVVLYFCCSFVFLSQFFQSGKSLTSSIRLPSLHQERVGGGLPPPLRHVSCRRVPSGRGPRVSPTSRPLPSRIRGRPAGTAILNIKCFPNRYLLEVFFSNILEIDICCRFSFQMFSKQIFVRGFLLKSKGFNINYHKAYPGRCCKSFSNILQICFCRYIYIYQEILGYFLRYQILGYNPTYICIVFV